MRHQQIQLDHDDGGSAVGVGHDDDDAAADEDDDDVHRFVRLSAIKSHCDRQPQPIREQLPHPTVDVDLCMMCHWSGTDLPMDRKWSDRPADDDGIDSNRAEHALMFYFCKKL